MLSDRSRTASLWMPCCGEMRETRRPSNAKPSIKNDRAAPHDGAGVSPRNPSCVGQNRRSNASLVVVLSRWGAIAKIRSSLIGQNGGVELHRAFHRRRIQFRKHRCVRFRNATKRQLIRGSLLMKHPPQRHPRHEVVVRDENSGDDAFGAITDRRGHFRKRALPDCSNHRVLEEVQIPVRVHRGDFDPEERSTLRRDGAALGSRRVQHRGQRDDLDPARFTISGVFGAVTGMFGWTLATNGTQAACGLRSALHSAGSTRSTAASRFPRSRTRRSFRVHLDSCHRRLLSP
jgi:hypothetical protein